MISMKINKIGEGKKRKCLTNAYSDRKKCSQKEVKSQEHFIAWPTSEIK